MEKKEQGALLGFFLFFGGLYWAGDSWKSADNNYTTDWGNVILGVLACIYGIYLSYRKNED